MARSPGFRQAISKPKALGPEHNQWFWNPNRFGIQLAPDHFMKMLHELGPELSATWNPIIERWQIWCKAPQINHKICQGWKLLFIVRGVAGEYLPLDERTLARLYSASVLSSGSAKQYFDRMVSEMERDKERREKQYQADLIDGAMPSFDHAKIQVSGFGKSSGSKFSTYHA
jgi:hypothetical protein